MQQSSISTLLDQLDEYKRKFYTNLLLKGILFSAAVVLSAYLLFNTLEYFGHFGSLFRTALFFSFVAVFVFSVVFWVIKPLIYLYGKQKPLSNEQAAQQIGRFFPEVGDRLLNTLQLVGLNHNQNELILASIEQKSQQLTLVKFADAVKLNENKKYIKYVAIPALAIIAILLAWPQFFTKSTTRIVYFTNEFAEEAPFTFLLENKELRAFRNEDYTVQLHLRGDAIPEAVYLMYEGRRFKMESTDQRHYHYTFRKVQHDIDFKFEAAGYSSSEYEIDLIARPNLTGFAVTLNYPAYLNKPNESVENTGNLSVPEGTRIEWAFDASETDAVHLAFEGEAEQQTAKKAMIGGFSFAKQARKSGEYQVLLKNKYASNREPVSFFLNVIPDKYPSISLEQYRDSTLYNYLVLGGNIGDDYGVSNLKLFYRIQREGGPEPKAYASLGIPFSKGQTIQSFYYQWATDSLKLAPGDKIEYFVQVWDNDGVNGAKSAKTGVMNYAIPSKKAIDQEIDQAVDKTVSQMDRSLSKAQQLKKELEALETRLRNKRDLDYQDKKQVEELLKKRQELQDEIRQLQELNQSLTEKQQRFSEQKPELAKKFEQLQKLMNELMKNDSDKLYEQLKQMLEKNQDERMLDMLDRLKSKERNAEKDLDRAMQLFKRLQREQKLDKTIEELKKLAENQDQLAQKSDQNKDQKSDKNQPNDSKSKDSKDAQKNEADSLKNQNAGEKDQDSKQDQKSQEKASPLQQEQQKLQEDMKNVKEELKQVEELNKELKDMENMDMGQQEQEDISKQQEQSMQDMKKGDQKSAAKKQKQAAQQMQKLAQKLSDMKQEAEMEENQENMDHLRDILENLVHLSFDQERLMKEFRGIQLADPRFVKLAQEQIKMQDDAKIIEDSLYSLAKRVMQIEAFVTREVGSMKKNMDDAAKSIRERKLSQATSRQQFAMTNMNNLALMLSDVLKQMQENAMNMMASGKGKGKKQKGNSPGMSKQQEQMNQQMQQMQQGGTKQGRQFSEQMAQMAAQQAAIRKQLQEAMERLKGTEAGKKLGNEANDLMKKMDQTEEDLVNKRLTPNTINRNKDILTRLLESEKAIQQQEEEEKRKSETAKPLPPKVPPAFEQYVKEKQKQTELLRTVPPSLAPFYKNEVDQYFKKLR